MRFSLSFQSISSISFFNSSEQAGNLGIFTYTLSNASKYSDVFLKFVPNGNQPLNAKRQTTTPNEKTSILESPSSLNFSSGAIYKGVPLTESFWAIILWSIFLANPKSHIFMIPLWMRILSGLMSRCIILLSQRIWQPLQIWFKKSQILSQDTCLDFDFKNDQKLPQLQYSIIMQKLCLDVISNFLQFTKFLCSGKFLRTYNQALTDQYLKIYSSNGMTFATSSSDKFYRLQALQTSPKFPFPINYSSAIRQGVPSIYFTLTFLLDPNIIITTQLIIHTIKLFIVSMITFKSKPLLSRLTNINRYDFIPPSTYDISSKPNPLLALKIGIDLSKAGTINIRLFENIVPKTSQNFKRLLLGSANYGSRKLSLINTNIVRFVPRAFLQLGKMEGGNCSIYGPTFRDQSFELLHDRPGLLSSISEENSNSSQFLVTLAPCPFLDYKNVVFGEITPESMNNLRNLQKIGEGMKKFKILDVKQVQDTHSNHHH